MSDFHWIFNFLYLIGSQLIEIWKNKFRPGRTGRDALWPLITQKVSGQYCSTKSQNVAIDQGYRSGKFRKDRLHTFPSRIKKHVYLLIFSIFAIFYVRRSFNGNNSASFYPTLMKLVSKHQKLTIGLLWTSLVRIGLIPTPPERFFCFSVLDTFLKFLVKFFVDYSKAIKYFQNRFAPFSRASKVSQNR